MIWQRNACLLFLILASTTTVLAAEKKVGALGDVDQIKFVGNHAYSADKIRLGLLRNLDITVAGRPEGELDLWMQTLSRLVKSGYQVSGYLKADVKVRHDVWRSTIIVEIDEGTVFHCGGIEFIGAKTLPVDKFRGQLTSWRPHRPEHQRGKAPVSPDLPVKTDKPIWKKGDRASFGEEYAQFIDSTLRQIFQSFGYFEPKFTISVRPEADRSATLIVAIDNEGPLATIDEYDIVGLQKNSAKDLIQYLEMPVGTPLDLRAKARIERKLWDSARFLKYHVEVVPTAAVITGRKTILMIEATEYEGAPPLSEELSDEQKTYLRLFRAFSKIAESEDDLEFVFSIPWDDGEFPADQELPAGTKVLRARGVMSPKNKSILLSLEIVELPDRVLMKYVAHATPTRFVIDAAPQKLRFDAPGIEAAAVFKVDWKDIPPDAEGKRNRIDFGAGYKTRSGQHISPFQVSATLPPVLALRSFNVDKLDMKFIGNLATINAGDAIRVSFDRQNGALSDIAFDNKAHVIAKVTCLPGVYNEWLAEHERSMDGAQRITPGEAPVTALTDFLLKSSSGLKHSDELPTSQLRALGRRILKHGGLHGFDTALNRFLELCREDDFESFGIPYFPKTELVEVESALTSLILPACHALLPRTDASRVLAREFVLANSMRDYKPTKSFEDFLSNGKIGPVTCLIAGMAFRSIDRGYFKAFSDRGVVQGIFGRGFQYDCDQLLKDDWPVGTLFVATTASLQEANEAEIEALSKLGPEKLREPLKRELSRLAANKKQPAEKALKTLYKAAWNQWLQPLVFMLTIVLSK